MNMLKTLAMSAIASLGIGPRIVTINDDDNEDLLPYGKYRKKAKPKPSNLTCFGHNPKAFRPSFTSEERPSKRRLRRLRGKGK
jgi:hypothetical protein